MKLNAHGDNIEYCNNSYIAKKDFEVVVSEFKLIVSRVMDSQYQNLLDRMQANSQSLHMLQDITGSVVISACCLIKTG